MKKSGKLKSHIVEKQKVGRFLPRGTQLGCAWDASDPLKERDGDREKQKTSKGKVAPLKSERHRRLREKATKRGTKLWPQGSRSKNCGGRTIGKERSTDSTKAGQAKIASQENLTLPPKCINQVGELTGAKKIDKKESRRWRLGEKDLVVA